MTIQRFAEDLSVCQLADASQVDFSVPFCFLSKTDEELSLVCRTACVPAGAIRRDDGWRMFRIQGVLDFSLIGILAEISGVLAAQQIGIFAISTYNTDYILTKTENYENALRLLEAEGYTIQD